MMNALKAQLLKAIEERDAANKAFQLASTGLTETKATVYKLSDRLAKETLGDTRNKEIVVSLGNGLGLWCVWRSHMNEPSTQIVEVKE